jgi:hypothetical protein
MPAMDALAVMVAMAVMIAMVALAAMAVMAAVLSSTGICDYRNRMLHQQDTFGTSPERSLGDSAGWVSVNAG